MIEELKQRARAGDLQALQELRERGFFGAAAAPARSYALSAAQRRMWILDRTSESSSAYNMPRALTVQGPLDRAALGRALNSIVERHESLRTTFSTVGDEPRQTVHSAAPVPISEADLRMDADPLSTARRMAAEEAPRPFDLATGPLFRVHLLRTGDAEHVLLFNVHHIVCDGWSLDNIVRELTALYRGDHLPPLAIQYKDFAVWHNEWLRSAKGEHSARYWRRALAAPLPVLDLPTDHSRPGQSASAGQTVTVDLGQSFRARLTEFANREGVTLFTALVTLTKALLHLESGQEDIIVGAPVAGRDQADVEPLIGMFANAVALRDRITANASFRELLGRVRHTVEDAFSHQGTPFDELVNDLVFHRTASRTPVFDVLVGLLNTDRVALGLGDLTLTEFETGTGLAPHDLVLYFVEGDGSLHVSALYRVDLFEEVSIRRLLARWQQITERAIATPELKLSELGAGAPALTASCSATASSDATALDLLAGRLVREAGVADAVVLPMAIDGDSAALVACVVPGGGASVEAISARVLATGIPVSRVVAISGLPLTGDGRVNVRALERLAAESLGTEPQVAGPRLHAWDLVPRGTDRRTASSTDAAVDSAGEVEDRPIPALASGPALPVVPGAEWTLSAVLRTAAAGAGSITYVRGDGTALSSSYEALAAESRSIAGSLTRAGCTPRTPIVLLLPEQSDVLPAFWGAVGAGAVPLVASPPADFSSPSRQVDHLAHIWSLLERPLLVTTRALLPSVLSLSRWFDVTPDRVLAIEDLRAGSAAYEPHQADPDDVAFFSLTSGSTGNPKCVMLTHRNALARARGMNQLCGCSAADVVLNWLPFDHIGSLSDWHIRCVDLGCSAVYAPPSMMLGDPVQWLAALDRYGATHSWAPNFAYALVTEALRAPTSTGAAAPRYDLSRVEMLLTAGEAVTPAAVESFLDALAPFGLRPGAVRPAFGMAEMASGVTYGSGGSIDRPMRFHRIDRTSLSGRVRPAEHGAGAATYADLGPPIAGVSLRIVDDAGAVRPEWRIGRLQISGLPIAKGYYRDADATNAVFFADGWFDTGDYGFLANGCLALTGRAKDGIIVSGANYSSAEIESVVEAVDGVAVSFVAAAAVRPEGRSDEALAIFYASDLRGAARVADLGRAIRVAVVEKIGIQPDYLVPVNKADIPKTAIGKIQRPQLVRQFEAGAFDELVRDMDLLVGADRTIPDWFSTKTWQPSYEGARRDIGRAIAVVGGDSALADALTTALGAIVAVPDADTIVFLAGTEHAESGLEASASGLWRLTQFLQPLAVARADADGHERRTTVLVVTIGAQVIDPRDTLRDDRAAWAGVALSLAQECPWLDLRVVDLDRETTEAAADWCLDELRREGGGRISAWRNQRRLIPRLASSRVALDPAGPPAFTNGALILVTGGTGGVGRLVVRHLREAYDARVLVVGRGPGDVAPGPDERVFYHQAEVCDPTALGAAVDAAEAVFGQRLAGAIHLAGVASDRPLIEETASTLSAVWRPKALGAVTVAELVRSRCGDQGVLVTFSSVNGFLGGAGASAYSAANAYVDAFTDDLRATAQLRCWNLAWSMWDDTGMSSGFAMREAVRAKGLAILRPDAALLSLAACLRRPPASVFVGADTGNPHLAQFSSRGSVVLRSAAGDRTLARVAPRTPVERKLARIWEDLLGVSDLAVHDHFVRLGGHSLKATQLVARIQKEFDTRVTLQDVFRVPTIEGLAAVVESGAREQFASIEAVSQAPHYPVSHSQRRLWVIEQMGLAGSAYHIEGATSIAGDIDIAALQRSVDAVVARHEALRTTFVEIDGQPRQVINTGGDQVLTLVDLREAADPDAEARRRIETASAVLFNLATGPLFRATLYRLSDTRAVLVLTMHHIVSDGWSMDVMVRELLDGYDRAHRGLALAAPPLRIHYKDFAAWQHRVLENDAAGHRSYWLDAFAGDLPIMDLPADRPRPAVQSFAGSVVAVTIDAVTGRAIRQFASAQGATAFMAWLTVIRLLVFKYTRAEDAIIATPVAGREHADLAGQVGFYVNMLPLRIPVSADINGADLLKRIQSITTSAVQHQAYPYDRLVEELAIRRDAGRNPLFDLVVSVTEWQGESALPSGLVTDAVDLTATTSKFDLTFFLSETASGSWLLLIEFNSDLFDEARIRRMADHVATLAASLVLKPDASISELDLLPAAERRLLVNEFPAEPSDYPRDQSIAQVFEHQALATPEQTAILSARGAFTYRELDARANGLAHVLRRHSVTPEEPIGILMAPSEWTAVALLGILKAGAAYLPLDITHPAARRSLMIADSRCRVIVSDGDSGDEHTTATFIDVRTPDPQDHGPLVEQSANALAYVMYTSGSTGRPKGSLIEQRSVLRLVKGANYLQLGPDDRVLQTGSLAFDASTFEFWGPLLNGGCLCIPAEKEVLDPLTLERLLSEWQISTMWCTAGLFNQMVDANVRMFGGLRQVLTGGERLSPSHVQRFRDALPEVRLINGYGPTENTTFTTCYDIRHADGEEVPLGRPISNTTVFVLDADGHPAPIGVAGEICAGGDGLARGYLNDVALTAERFVPHPFEPGARLYRTGDAGRWRADGLLEFAGRIDQQLKIRGYRVEPGEIEIAIRQQPGVDDAVVIARTTSAGTHELIAYVTSSGTLSPSGLRAGLAASLPDYMVPAHWVQLDRFPLNASLKVDRAALPAPGPRAESASSEHAAPRTAEERALAEAWGELLGGSPGVHDNYFELGGDSIRAIQLASRLRRQGWRLQVRDVFTHPTIAALAGHLRPLAAADEVKTRHDVPGPVPMTAAQHWFFAHHHGPLSHFNQAVLITPQQVVQEAPLRAALTALVDRHDALRLVFPQRNQQHVAEVRPTGAPAWLDLVDLRSSSNATKALASQLDEMHPQFDLEHGPLFRAALLQMPIGQRLWLCGHHLAVDGVSWRIILEQLTLAYQQAASGEAVDLGDASASFRDRADESVRFATSDALRSELATFAFSPEPTGVGDDTQSTYGTSVTLAATLSTDETRLLLSAAHHAYNTEINDLLLAALGRALGEWSGEESTVIDLEGHGRERLLADLDLTRTVGWFTSIYPVTLPAHASYRDQIRGVKETLRAIPRRGVSYGIGHYSRPATDGSLPNLPAVSFNYLGQIDTPSSGPAWFAFAPEASGSALAPGLNRAHAFDIVAIVTDAQLSLSVLADTDRRDQGQRLLDAVLAQLRLVVAHCQDRPAERTPSDFTISSLSLVDYDALLSSRGWRGSEIDDVSLATPMQEGLLLLSVLDTHSPAYRVQMAYTLSGHLDALRFENAWRAVGRAHPVLRSAFVHEGLDRPLRVTLRDRVPSFTWYDLRSLSPEAQTARVREERDRDLATGFDFERDTLMRFIIFQLGEARWEVVWTYHHVLLDGWSLGLVFRDFAAAYGVADGAPPLLPPGPDPAEYSRWLARQNPEDGRTWWNRYLDGYDQAATVPGAGLDHASTPVDGELVVELTAGETAVLADTAGRWGVTTATLVLAAWGVVLSRYNRTNDVVFGSIVSGRPAELADSDRMVGAFINAVPVRVRMPETGLVQDLAIALQADLAGAERFHHVPLADIQGATPLGRDLFSHMVIIENYPVEKQLVDAGRAAQLQIDHLEAHDRTHYSFSLTVVPGDTLAIGFQYDASRHDPAQVERTAGHYLNVLRAFGSIAKLDDLEIMSEVERDTVLRRYQPARRTFADGTVVELVSARAAQAPDQIAVSGGATATTYRELVDQAARMAAVLSDAGIGLGDRVGVLMERHPAVPVALLAVMHAGAAYVPLDPDYPKSRLEFMVADSGCRAIVTTTQSMTAIALGPVWQTIHRAGDVVIVADSSAVSEAAAVRPGPADPAYVMYTSGSTGTPKGVVIPHRALASQAQWFVEEFGVTSDDRYFQKAPISFDASVEEIYAPLVAGGRVVMPGPDEHLDPDRLAAALIRNDITLLQLVPSQLAMMLDAGWDPSASPLRILFLGSEALDVSLLSRLPKSRQFEVVNLYGPTETCDNAATWRWDGRTTGPVPIGIPVANTRAYVVDERLMPVPPGILGEICLGGDNLALGYHNRADLTAERFVHSMALGERLYRTGDLGRWVEPGVLEYSGRIDQQVKIRGHRIECGEIEAQLRSHAGVQDCAVVVGRPDGQPELVAFHVARTDASPAPVANDLRRWLAARLLDAMVPARFVALEQLPVMPNGKIDRRSLEAITSIRGNREGGADRVAPRDANEITIAGIWSGVLGVADPDVRTNFFEAGGHSLKAMQIVSRIHRDLGIRVTLRDLFDHPTIEGLASLSRPVDRYAAIEPAAPQATYALSHAQQRLWLLHNIPGGESAYNMPSAFWIEGTALDINALEQAFAALLDRHEALRTAFVLVDGEPRQQIQPPVSVRIERVDLRDAEDAEAHARSLAEQEALRPFDLASPPLLRVTAIAMPGAAPRTVILLTIHHIVGDGWSGEVLEREIAILYDAFRTGEGHPLLPLRIQYKDFSEWQNARSFEADEAWWLRELEGVPDQLMLPTDYAAATNRDFRGAIEQLVVDTAVTAGLSALAIRRGTTLSHTVLALFMLTLNRLSGQNDLCVGMSVANRNHPDLEGLIGFFVNVLPVRGRFAEGMLLDDLLDRVSASATGALDRQDYPFDRLVQRLNPNRTTSRHPLINVVYAFQNFGDLRLEQGSSATDTDSATTIRPFEFAFRTSKFDLTLFVSNEADTLRLTLEYDTGLFAPATAKRHLALLARFARMAAAPAEVTS